MVVVRILAPAASVESFDALLSVLVGLNVVYLRTHVGVPSLYASGVRYAREPPGFECWAAIPIVIQAGEGDCDDLACWRVAELRASGEDPDARTRIREIRPRRWHVDVVRGDGRVEDPSRVLGMM
jgi:hypothetical protein